MSTELATIEKTGKLGVELTLTEFAGPRGKMLQLTQGFGTVIDQDEPGFIQLTTSDTYELIQCLTRWLQQIASEKADDLKLVIERDKALRKTILGEALGCSRFIEDLEILRIPLTLIGMR